MRRNSSRFSLYVATLLHGALLLLLCGGLSCGESPAAAADPAVGGSAGSAGSEAGSAGAGGMGASSGTGCGGVSGNGAGASGGVGGAAGSGGSAASGAEGGSSGVSAGGVSGTGAQGGAAGLGGSAGVGAGGGLGGNSGVGGNAGMGGGAGVGGSGDPQCGRIELHDGWYLQSSAVATQSGAVISESALDLTGWHATRVPATALASLVADATYADPDFGMNLRALPGMDYPLGANFSNQEMSNSSPFAVPWWYRLAFDVPASLAGQRVTLHLDGINYRADLWLNGSQVAAKSDLVGTFRAFEFDITDKLRFGEQNVLALAVSAPRSDDLAMTFVDWMPLPPDKNLGLWRAAYLSTSGAVVIRNPQVQTELALPALDKAELTVFAEVENRSATSVSGVLRGKIEGLEFEQLVVLAPAERKLVTFSVTDFPELELDKPRVWWPYQLGCPDLYTLELEFVVNDQVSACASERFGVREVTTELDADEHLVFSVNGRRLQIRGAGWAPDILLRADPERERDEVRLVKDMQLNTLRLEGKFGSESLLDICDEAGLLVIAGWCCCDQWEQWDEWDTEDRKVAEASLVTQAQRLRNHPSVISWWNASDGPAPANVEQLYLDVLERERWDVPRASSASEEPSPLSGATGLKMNGPYDYVPPSYWSEDRTYGGAFGFNTETSPGPAIPERESLEKFLPTASLWPIDSVWSFHAGGGQFDDLAIFNAAVTARYGAPASLDDYLKKAQLLAYDGQRAMFEAFRRNQPAATGVIQWMLNDGWPKVIWHLFDRYLSAAGGYYGTKKANAVHHVLYDYATRGVVVVNDGLEADQGLTVRARVLSLDMQELAQQTQQVDVPAAGVTAAFVLSVPPDTTGAYFVALVLEAADQQRLEENLYVLSGTPDVLDWDKTTWYHTPVSRHADLRDLVNLPSVALDVTSSFEELAGELEVEVTLSNPGPDIAFFVRLQLVDAANAAELLPTFWEDNYVSILPAESRTLRARYKPPGAPEVTDAAACAPANAALGDDRANSHAAAPQVVVQGWNVARGVYDPQFP